MSQQVHLLSWWDFFQPDSIDIWSLGCLDFKTVLTNTSTVFRMLSKEKATIAELFREEKRECSVGFSRFEMLFF